MKRLLVLPDVPTANHERGHRGRLLVGVVVRFVVSATLPGSGTDVARWEQLRMPGDDQRNGTFTADRAAARRLADVPVLHRAGSWLAAEQRRRSR
jgi:hypothetical protein